MAVADLLADAVERLGQAGVESPEVDARRMGEEASGSDGAAFRLRLDDVASEDDAARFAELVTRRLTGEPLQYVLGRWGFRTLDLLVDRRVLIPRPETEQVVEAALAELDRLTRDLHASNRRRRVNVIDLGCGSGAVGLSIAAERHAVDVWCVDASADAVAVTESQPGPGQPDRCNAHHAGGFLVRAAAIAPGRSGRHDRGQPALRRRR